ncbi:hypothetical protein ABZP36_008575 [Zizania latifolia]
MLPSSPSTTILSSAAAAAAMKLPFYSPQDHSQHQQHQHFLQALHQHHILIISDHNFKPQFISLNSGHPSSDSFASYPIARAPGQPAH